MRKYKMPFNYIILIVISLLFLSACNRENDNMDEIEIFPDDVIPEIVEIDLSVTCDEPFLSLESSFLSYEMQAIAEIFIGEDCSGGFSGVEYKYLIYQSDFDFDGITNKFSWIPDGIPAINFASNTPIEAGDEVEPFINQSIFRLDFDNPGYMYDEIVIEIEAAGDEVGESIKGTITGLLLNPDNEFENVTGSFCVEIVAVCQ